MENNLNLVFFDDISEKAYDELFDSLAININGLNLLINDKTTIKTKFLQLLTIGYERKLKEYSDFNKNIQGDAIVKLSASGTYVDDFVSIRDAERKSELSPGTINYSMKKGRSVEGFFWIKKSDYDEIHNKRQ